VTVPNSTPSLNIVVSPANGATGVAVNNAVTVTFSLSIQPSTLTTSIFTLTGRRNAGERQRNL